MSLSGFRGSYGEKIAAEFLKSKGYFIIERNFRCRAGEIDIIASDDNYVVFVEVKLRKNSLHGYPREFVTVSKQKKIIKAARLWLLLNRTDLQPRFDVIEILAPDNKYSDGDIEIEYLENAY